MSNEGLVYLTNSTSEDSAGWYDPAVAEVLLNSAGSNWEASKPPGKRGAPDAGSTPPATPAT